MAAAAPKYYDAAFNIGDFKNQQTKTREEEEEEEEWSHVLEKGGGVLSAPAGGSVNRYDNGYQKVHCQGKNQKTKKRTRL